jgi:hypothetical protein
LKWSSKFIHRRCICDHRKGHSGRPSVSEKVVDHVRESFLCSPKKSMHIASRELQVPHSTISKIFAYTCGFTLTICNWSKRVYTWKTRKRDMHFAKISKR